MTGFLNVYFVLVLRKYAHAFGSAWVKTPVVAPEELSLDSFYVTFQPSWHTQSQEPADNVRPPSPQTISAQQVTGQLKLSQVLKERKRVSLELEKEVFIGTRGTVLHW